MPRETGDDQLIWRCPTCQVALYSSYGRRRSGSSVAARSTIRASVSPDVHIYTRSKLPWVELPESVPAFEVYYDSKKLWPAASLERLQALRP